MVDLPLGSGTGLLPPSMPLFSDAFTHRGSLTFLRNAKEEPRDVTMLSLHQLTCFLATYEHGSLTAAAEELGYAQPSVSEQIKTLEKSLGVQLFRRVGRGVVPTTVADTLRPYAERVLASVDEATQAVQS